jgi:esterase/lipase superfamily enzyme
MQGVLAPTAQSSTGTSQVSVLAATTRARSSEDAASMFGSDPAPEMSFAAITVSIPPDDVRKAGEIQWPTSLPGDPGQNFVTSAADYLDKSSFNAALTKTAKQGNKAKVLVFVHGFNNRFDDSVYRYAQIVHDSGAPAIPVLFSWPSRGEVSLRAYRGDRESAGASRDALVELLDTLAANPNVREITVLAHSMGSWLALEALASKSLRTGGKIKNVLLVAPDVSFEEFHKDIQDMVRPKPRIALFVSTDDQALKISQSIWNGQKRVGDANPDEEPFRSEFEKDGIAVFDLTNLQGNAHSRAFEDVKTVVGMIEQRFAEGQQLTDRKQVTVDAGE